MDRPVEQRVYYGRIEPADFAKALVANFGHGDLEAQQIGTGDQVVVQIASSRHPTSGGRTALAVHLTAVEDGVLVRMGRQDWLGVAASLGATALMALLKPISFVSRVDDLAQDIAALGMTDRAWETIDLTAETLGASHELSERLRRLTCAHCLTANPVGAPACTACGAPLGPVQPSACRECGNLLASGGDRCPQCGAPVV
ncbi:MAG: zinc ribbon domain-containing protein [Anaerolineales bacterium]|nr:zinc ribbon domain-containing protein [Anaerolineales bacterium]